MSRKKTNKIEAETGEVVQSNKPFVIRNGGIAKPLGQGLYLLGGKTHEQGGIDIDFTGDARIFSAQPILNGSSPAELVAKGANPNKTFIRQELFKDINGINDDGSKKAKCGKRIKAENGIEIPGMRLAKKLNLLKSTEENPVYAEMENPLWRSTENLNRDFINNAINEINNGAKAVINKEGKVKYLKGEVNVPADHKIITEDNLKSIRKGLDYIGGDKTQSRLNYFKKVPALVNMVDSLSNVYGINKDVMLHRLSKEGLIDNKISEYNHYLDEKGQRNINEDILKYIPSGFYELGLDRAGEHLAKGDYNMRWKDKNLGYYNSTGFNEKGNVVGTVHVPNMASGLEIKAAHIEYLTNLMKKKYPNSTKKELNALVNAAYNLGENHKDLNDKEWINKNYEVLPWSEMINKNMNNSNKKQLGGSTGLIRVQTNGKDRLMYVPFTGEETKVNRKKAIYGKELSVPKLSYDFTKVDKIMESIKEGNKNKSWWKDNSDYVISGLGNISAGLTSYFINKNMLKDLNYAPSPVVKRATKLKTNININPELTALNENLYKTIDRTNANIASSRVANAMNQEAALNTTLAKNKLYADKENRETALINQDRINQQEIANTNIDAYNEWNQNKVAFNNTIREKQSENSISLIDNINKGIQTSITDAEKRRQFKNNLAVMAAAYPNVTPQLLRSYGFDIELPRITKFGGIVKYNKKK